MTIHLKPSRRLLVLTAAALTLALWASNGAEGSPETVEDALAVHGASVEQYSIALDKRFDAHVAECMRSRGHTEVTPPPAAESIPARVLEVANSGQLSQAFVESEGFGIASSFEAYFTDRPPQSRSRSAPVSPQYERDLFGTGEHPDGCVAQADIAMAKVTESDAAARLAQGINQFEMSVLESRSGREIISTWSACMGSHGFDLKAPVAIHEMLSGPVQEAHAGAAVGDWDAVDALRDLEIPLAEAAFDCAEGNLHMSGMPQSLADELSHAEQGFVRENGDLIAEVASERRRLMSESA